MKTNSLCFQAVVGVRIQAEAAFSTLRKWKEDDFVSWKKADPASAASHSVACWRASAELCDDGTPA